MQQIAKLYILVNHKLLILVNHYRSPSPAACRRSPLGPCAAQPAACCMGREEGEERAGDGMGGKGEEAEGEEEGDRSEREEGRRRGRSI
uniref:Uncharacterized protein n=1 Tax=Oryza sativa subsp. japonica TaxID=39947 RepID=Q5Z924_ORYSJ|nr:hypothetical protein [Oryza sativa Japonica Group]